MKAGDVTIDVRELIDRVRAGETDAFAPLVRRYEGRIRAFCLSHLSDPAEADDAAQEIFIKAFRSLRKFRGQSAFSTWLHRIAINHCLDLLRKKSRTRTESWDALLEEEGENIQRLLAKAPATSSEEDVDLIRRVLDQLTPSYRSILLLRELQSFSYEEMAQALGTSLDAIKARLARARQEFSEKLRHFLKPPNV